MTRTHALDAKMRGLIARLNVLSQVAAANPNSGAKSTDEAKGGRRPTGEGMSGGDWWQRYVDSSSPDRVVDQAEDELKHATHAPKEKPAGETPQQERQRQEARVRQLSADGGWTTADIARDTCLTVGQVRKILMDEAVDARLNKRERAAQHEVIALYQEDPSRTVRYLAARCDVPKSTVQEWLKKAA